MPREFVLGNGRFLVNLDHHLRLREVYFPLVGLEDHLGGHASRVGFWCDERFSWFNKSWQFSTASAEGAPVASSTAHSGFLNLDVRDTTCVHPRLNVLVRRIDVTNPAGRTREVRAFFQNDFHLYGETFGDTALFDPETKALIHYKRKRYFLCTGRDDAGNGMGQYACGAAGVEHAGKKWEGTYVDAEDGKLEGNPVAQGLVDSTAGFSLNVPAGGTRTIYYWTAAGRKLAEVREIHQQVLERSPQALVDETRAHWHAWHASSHKPAGLSPRLNALYARSLEVLAAHCSRSGGVLAALDGDNLQFNRDVYSYVWPRDGAICAHALDQAGYPEYAKKFFIFCGRVETAGGAFLHKYAADGSVGSTWHAWLDEHGQPRLPIQEDSTGLVAWALWSYFSRNGDRAFVKRACQRFAFDACDFMVKHRSASGLPLPSYDLWEERFGTTAYQCATVYAGLSAGARLARAFDDYGREEKYGNAALGVKNAVLSELWAEEEGRFARMAYKGKLDLTVDSSMAALAGFGLLEPGEGKARALMSLLRSRLWVKGSGGLARYEEDYYHRVSHDVPGNPWVITTLWYASWLADVASSADELAEAVELLEWAADRATPSGMLPEQVNPFDGRHLSVSPLAWSHAEFALAALKCSRKAAELERGLGLKALLE